MNAGQQQERAQVGRWTLLFEPLGVLVFRDDRPFDAGLHFLARSRLPLPSVFRGAVRTALFRQAGANFSEKNFGIEDPVDRELLGSATQAEAFGLRGPFIVRRKDDASYECVLPWPQDLAPLGFDGAERLEAELLCPRTVGGTPGPTCLRLGFAADGSRELQKLQSALPWTDQKLNKPDEVTRWLTAAGARRYAEHREGTLRLDEADWLNQKTFLDKERRVGIARDTDGVGGRLVAAESMLYTLIAWRMAPSFRFAVELELEDGRFVDRATQLLRELDGGLVRLGGRSQHARVEVIEGGLASALQGEFEPKPSEPSKLWLWTPGLFNPSVLADELGLLGAVGKSVRLGGFDMARHRPRPLVNALDQGSVLWFSGPDPVRLANHQRSHAKEHGHPIEGGYGQGMWIGTSTSTTGSDA